MRFKPSQVVVIPHAPLVGALGKAEAEHAAVTIVLLLAANGDEWRAVEIDEIIAFLRECADKKIEPLASLLNNPFFKPSPGLLVERGFAERSADNKSIKLTEAGIERLAKFVDVTHVEEP